MHPLSPLLEASVNVPKGHGVNSLPFCLNPEAKRAEMYNLLSSESGPLTYIASAWTPSRTGLLQESNFLSADKKEQNPTGI